MIKKRITNDLNAIEYEKAFWQKIFHPINALVMVYLAVPFVFGPLRNSQYGQKLMIGGLISFSFYVMNSVISSVTVFYRLAPQFTQLIPCTFFIILGFIIAKNTR